MRGLEDIIHVVFADVLLFSLALGFPFEEQVVIDHGRSSHGLIGVETPATLLMLLNNFANSLVVIDLHTHPFFQLRLTVSPSDDQADKDLPRANQCARIGM